MVSPEAAAPAPMAHDPHILVVDDDRRLRNLLRRYLAENGFRVTTAADAGQARARMRGLDFDLLVLDLMMPGENGLDLARSLRRDSAIPILMLTAMGETEDRIAGLERGADDYLPKPFEPRELVLRIKRILERTAYQGATGGAVVFGDCCFDQGRGELTRGGQRVRLTTAETNLLKMLARRPGEPFDREQLLRAGGEGASDRAIDVQVARLRRKIEPDPKLPRYLCTVRGKGYVLRPD